MVASKIAGEETTDAACPSFTESDDHHNWRGCLKRMKCCKGPEGNWETEPPGDPQDLPEGYQVSPCENCCTIIPNHSTDNCPHPECCYYGVQFTIARGEPYIMVLQASRRGYLNRITEIDELCPICKWFVMRNIEGVVKYHNPEECLKSCRIVLKEGGDQWEIKFDAGEEPSPVNLCAGGQHAHESWQEYRQCYANLQEKYSLCRELRALRGDKTHELCQVCADIFVDHANAQCPIGPGSENPSLLSFWDDPTGSLIWFIGTMVEHANGTQTGPCPLCTIQEDQHDYTTCLRAAKIELREGELSVMTSRRHHGDPPPDPNPTGPTPGTTPRTAQKTPGPMPSADSPSQGTSGSKGMIMKGRYTCYA